MTDKTAGVASGSAAASSERLPTLALPARAERLRRFRNWLLPTLAVLVVVVGQLVEDLNDGSALHLLPPGVSVRRWAIIALVTYEVIVAAYLQRTARRSLRSLKPVLKVEEDQYTAHERGSHPLSPRAEMLILLLSAAVVALVFVFLRVDPLTDDPNATLSAPLPVDMLAALVVLAGYTALGWTGLRLAYLTVRLATMLGRLSREPLEINVFNTTNLLPFGNLALAVALAPAGVTALLFIGLGAPGTVQGWTVLVLFTLAALLGLFVPLRGIHHQMSHARDRALLALDQRAHRLFEDTIAAPFNSAEEDLARLRDTANTVIPLRNQVAQMTTWPFRNTAGLARAMLIVSAPLIYTALNEVIRISVERLVP